jgi:hypothetical protein
MDPIVAPRDRRHAEVMLSQRTSSAVADRRLADATDVEVEALPRELEALAEAFRAAGRSLDSLASRVVPAAEPCDPSVCSRYQRAAASWPTTPSPSHEAFAAGLARFHDAADAARVAARRCDEARLTVEALLRPAPRPPSR